MYDKTKRQAIERDNIEKEEADRDKRLLESENREQSEKRKTLV